MASSSASTGDITMLAAWGGPVGLSLPHDGRRRIERTTGTRRNLMARSFAKRIQGHECYGVS
jgi:hypothetical protein